MDVYISEKSIKAHGVLEIHEWYNSFCYYGFDKIINFPFALIIGFILFTV